MSPTAGPNDTLRDDNYFTWEFNARMALARKDLLDHVHFKIDEDIGSVDRSSHAWRAADMRAFAILSRLLSPQFQTMVREATSARHAWEILEAFFVRRNLHNRIQLRRKLHGFRMLTGVAVLDHLLEFDNLCLALAAVGDPLQDDEKLVVLLGGLPPMFDTLVRVIENNKDLTLAEVKEILRREYDSAQHKEQEEVALKAHRLGHGRDRTRGIGRQQRNVKPKFAGRCFKCDRVGHKQSECRSSRQGGRRDDGDTSKEYVFAAADDRTSAWVLDSEASSHMSNKREDFVNLRPLAFPAAICVADGTEVQATDIGSVSFAVPGGSTVTLTEVLFVPDLDRRLLSVAALTLKQVDVHFGNGMCSLAVGGKTIVQIPQVGKLFVLNSLKTETQDQARRAEEHDAALWHARLGHVPHSRIDAVRAVTEGVPVNLADGDDGDPLCSGCAMGKMPRAAFKKQLKTVKAARVLELVHCDLMGPMDTKTPSGARYALTMIDDYSRFITIRFLATKDQTYDCLVEYRAMMEKQLGVTLKRFRTDNGGEFANKRFHAFCQANGIVHQTTVPYSPQQNGLAERMNRTIAEMARAMLFYKRVEKRWWAEAFNTAVYVINLLPNTVRPAKSPYEVWFGSRPSLQHLRVFGSEGFVHVDSHKRTKLESKAVPCIFLGYASFSKGYRVWDMHSKKIVITRSVVLDERGHPGYTAASDSDQEPRWTASVFDEDGDEEEKVVCNPSSPPAGLTDMDVDMTDQGDAQQPQGAEPMDVESVDNPIIDQAPVVK